MPKTTTPELGRSDRILIGKLHLLYRSNVAVPANFVVAAIVAYTLRGAFPHPVLYAWLGLNALVVVTRMALHRRFSKADNTTICTHCWAIRFALGSLASGLLWGLFCAGLAFWGTPREYLLMTFVAAGMAAGALAAISVYLPAYLAYAGAFVLPLAAVELAHDDSYIVAAGIMLIVYFGVLWGTARQSSAVVNRTLELKVDNEILQTSLNTTRGERDAARTEKWSTLAQLSHELRTPLNAILGFSEAMTGEIFGTLGHSRYKEYAVHVHDSGRDLLNLADELLLLSQGESGALTLDETAVDLPALIQALADIKMARASQAGIGLQTEVAPDLPLLMADRTKLRQMLLHLMDNAVKFTRRDGQVQLTAIARADGGVDISVCDNGIGMRSADIPLAMQPFRRLAVPQTFNMPGAGLGLPICHRLAEAHGATLTIESALGEGTACTIAFPASRAIAASNVVAA